ncbi:MAG: hypothetical protein HWD90_06765 [Campylobacteraceae bacterium]|nr:hypothetical protein [Campylobacteraceae bacterium]
MTNAETIAKLNEALEKLIVAYEQLQNSYDQLQDEHNTLENENEKLNSENNKLKDKISALEAETRNLEDNLNSLQDSSEKDSSNINSMLSKIEGLLSKKAHPEKHSYDEDTSKVRETIQEVIVDKKSDTLPLDNTEVSDEIKENKETQNNNTSGSSSEKIDLNRMASLLNGFNN